MVKNIPKTQMYKLFFLEKRTLLGLLSFLILLNVFATRIYADTTANTSASVLIPSPTPTPTSTPVPAATGPASAPVCHDSKPGSAPRLLSATAGTNSVTLTWLKASNPVTYYLVAYSTTSGSQQYGNPNVGGTDTTSYTVRGLSGAVTYYFKVRAGNGCMPGGFSNELSVTTGGGFISGPAEGFTPEVSNAPAVPKETPGEKPLFDISLNSPAAEKSKFPILPVLGGLVLIAIPVGVFIVKYIRYKKKTEK
jgi:hypothetical protein